ncbi:hypothetical protein [Xenorhabdus anantnagensis]|uniref:Inverse autotransporter beta-barrel domain-containing protein n=1 Tax=Xenorhabdus anantnagensis TaxID=3025875 RepID=A0ABT5LT36_9GAMM|nr:hypothetical protein [Xenorhabdus anantnagensis]MDC9597583.1 hypothetical protein [Xenorhabdus anantnagensis]
MSLSMKFSLPNNTDLIIGQHLLFTVTLISDEIIKPNSTILFTKNININVPSDPVPVKPLSDGNKKIATATVELVVSDSISEYSSISFNVEESISGFQTRSLKYTARTIDPQSLKLSVNPKILDMPTSSNDPPKGTIFSKVETIIQDKNGKPLSSVPVFITSSIQSSLEEVHIFYADDKKARINTQHIGNNEGVFIISDKYGNLVFYIYPQESLSLVINLFSLIPNSTQAISAQSPIFVIYDKYTNQNSPLQRPEIMNFWTGNLSSNGSQNFYVSIMNYDNAIPDDNVLFFVNGNYIDYFFTIENPKKELGSYFIKLPYYIFNYYEKSELSYIIVNKKGDALVSEPLILTYMGGAIYQPSQNVEREYDPCIVYTSLGVNPDNIIPNNNDIDYDAIKYYEGNNSTQNTGLFVEILGGDKSKGKIPLNSHVKLNIYISGGNKGFIKSFTGRMPAIINSKTQLASLMIHIPYEEIVNIQPYYDNSSGTIYFDYEFSINETVSYGKIWFGSIDTSES